VSVRKLDISQTLLTMKKVIFTVLLLTLFSSVHAQKKWMFNTGIGMPKLLYVGMGRKVGQGDQIKLTAGLISTLQGSVTSVTFENDILLANSSKYEEVHTWYLGQQFNYLDVRDSDKTLPENGQTNLLGLSIVLGRQINFTSKIGLNLEIGPLYYFYASNSISKIQQNDFRLAGAIGYFLRF